VLDAVVERWADGYGAGGSVFRGAFVDKDVGLGLFFVDQVTPGKGECFGDSEAGLVHDVDEQGDRVALGVGFEEETLGQVVGDDLACDGGDPWW